MVFTRIKNQLAKKAFMMTLLLCVLLLVTSCAQTQSGYKQNQNENPLTISSQDYDSQVEDDTMTVSEVFTSGMYNVWMEMRSDELSYGLGVEEIYCFDGADVTAYSFLDAPDTPSLAEFEGLDDNQIIDFAKAWYGVTVERGKVTFSEHRDKTGNSIGEEWVDIPSNRNWLGFFECSQTYGPATILSEQYFGFHNYDNHHNSFYVTKVKGTQIPEIVYDDVNSSIWTTK